MINFKQEIAKIISNITNININESTGTHLVASIPSWGQIAPGQTRNFYISQILTNLKYIVKHF